MTARSRTILTAIISAGVLAQLWLAHRYYGFLTGDDVEVLCEAFRVAVGYPYRPWDIRNLFVPDVVVAPIIHLSAAMGVTSTRAMIEAAALPFIGLSAVTTWLVYRLAVRWRATEAGALIAAALFIFHWIPLSFGSTVYPRTLASACIVGAALLVDRKWKTAAFAAGVLLSLAFADRFSEIIFLVPLLILCVAAPESAVPASAPNRLGKASVLLAGCVLGIGLTCGLFDFLTWGEAFSSLRKFARLTLVAPDFASRVKYQSPFWYGEMLPRWFALTLVPFVWKARRYWRPFAFVLLPLLALSLVRHKELRYLQALIPFVCIAAGIGAGRLRSQPIVASLVVLSLGWNLAGMKYLRKKTMPAVMAAEVLAMNPAVHGVAMSQLWAYGDRLYLGGKMGVVDVGTPPRDLPAALKSVDAASLYESDLTPETVAVLSARGLHRGPTFRDPPAREVVIFLP